jgi:hypothetical protein
MIIRTAGGTYIGSVCVGGIDIPSRRCCWDVSVYIIERSLYL